MAIKTTEQQLEEVQAAITAVLAGQSYTIDGVTVTRANLRELTEREKYLMQIYQSTGTSKITRNYIEFGEGG
jgi:lantibiotic modifying enzyme